MARITRTTPLSSRPAFARSAIAAAALATACAAIAQEAPSATPPAGMTPAEPPLLGTIVVTGRAEPPPAVGGWGDVPLRLAPFQATLLGSEALRDLGATRLADVTRADPSVSDAYNTEGYWDTLTVRGYVIDNRYNFRRDGLPINAETSIPLDNKERVEVLKGTSGLQAGTSAPGGLVNLVVKRPTAAPLRQATLGWRSRGSLLGAVDLSQRFGTDQAFGLRLNAAAERLRPQVRDAEGERHLLALAGDWRIGGGTLLELEIETSRRRQPSVPGFSLLGNTLPDIPDPRINLNNQPWSQPVVMDGHTGSLRLTQPLAAGWRATLHAARQRLRTQDRLAYPYGCYDDTTDTYYGDRYCPDGRYDLYDFRSENERRHTDALDLSLHGELQSGGLRHAITAGVLRSSVKARFERQAYNYVGQGHVSGTVPTPADPALTDENTPRDERSTEFHLRDAVRFGSGWTAWAGLRHTRLERRSVRTDGSRATAYDQAFTTPWLALSRRLGEQTLVYASWGRGVESEVAPNRARYTNAGEALPALRSRQFELGLKGGQALPGGDLSWNLAAYEIERPAFADLPIAGRPTGCDGDNPAGGCTRQVDGAARHRGLEAQAGWRQGAWSLQAGLGLVQARRIGSADPTVDGLRPPNVPARTLKLAAGHDLAALPGLGLQAALVAESDRMVLPDNSVRIPGWARLDAGLRWQQRTPSGTLTWRAGVDNLLDRRAWREAPFQYGHAYLFPLAPRSFRLSVEAAL